jgi:hypothetical protein
MAGNRTDYAETQVVAFTSGNSGTPPTTPLKVRLMTANGDDATPGTEVTGGSYVAQTVTFTTGANAADVTFTGLPACTVVGAEIWDSAGTPKRWWAGAATASKTYQAGDTAQITAGALTLADD